MQIELNPDGLQFHLPMELCLLEIAKTLWPHFQPKINHLDFIKALLKLHPMTPSLTCKKHIFVKSLLNLRTVHNDPETHRKQVDCLTIVCLKDQLGHSISYTMRLTQSSVFRIQFPLEVRVFCARLFTAGQEYKANLASTTFYQSRPQDWPPPQLPGNQIYCIGYIHLLLCTMTQKEFVTFSMSNSECSWCNLRMNACLINLQMKTPLYSLSLFFLFHNPLSELMK